MPISVERAPLRGGMGLSLPSPSAKRRCAFCGESLDGLWCDRLRAQRCELKDDLSFEVDID